MKKATLVLITILVIVTMTGCTTTETKISSHTTRMVIGSTSMDSDEVQQKKSTVDSEYEKELEFNSKQN